MKMPDSYKSEKLSHICTLSALVLGLYLCSSAFKEDKVMKGSMIWLAIVVIITGFIGRGIAGNRNDGLVIAFGQDKPPFVFGQEKRGLEIDIVREALKHKGISFSVMHMPNNRLQVALLKMKNIDGVATVRKKDDGTYYSNDFITFNNLAVTKKKSGIVINNISDLKGLTIVIWQKAYKDLGKEFEKMFSPEPPYNSPYFNHQYQEIASQKSQNKMFWEGRAKVIIVDKTIFEFYRKKLSKELNTSEEVVYHRIFPELTYYQVAFKDKQLRDDFNEGLKYIKAKGIYQQLVDNYIK